MNDTPPEVQDRVLAMLAERTPEERLLMTCSMYDAGIALLKAGILHEQPDITPAQMRGEIFMRLYGDCFSEEEARRIVRHLEAHTEGDG